MPAVNIYLPEALHARAKAAGLNISALTQRAIQERLDNVSLTTEDPDLKDLIAMARPTVLEAYDPQSKSFHPTRLYVNWIVDTFGHDPNDTRSFGITRKGSFVLAIDQPEGGVSLSTYSGMTLGEALDQLDDNELAHEVREALGGTVDLDI